MQLRRILLAVYFKIPHFLNYIFQKNARDTILGKDMTEKLKYVNVYQE